jgi:hypothetical protein
MGNTFKTVDAWVHAINEKAREIEEWMATVHPSCWGDEQFQQLNAEFRAIAGARVLEAEEHQEKGEL